MEHSCHKRRLSSSLADNRLDNGSFHPDVPQSTVPRPLNRSHRSPDIIVRSERKSRLLTAGCLAAIAVALGFGFWSVSRQLAPQIVTASAPAEDTNAALIPQKSIAVLPFENLSEDKQNAFLADGVQDDILSALSKNCRSKSN